MTEEYSSNLPLSDDDGLAFAHDRNDDGVSSRVIYDVARGVVVEGCGTSGYLDDQPAIRCSR